MNTIIPRQDAVSADIEPDGCVRIAQYNESEDRDEVVLVHISNLRRFIDALTDLAKQIEA